MKFIRVILITICGTATLCMHAQNGSVDSLLIEVKKQKEDTNKVKTLLELSNVCSSTQILQYSQPALELALKLNYQKGIAGAYGNIGTDFFYKSNAEKAIEYHKKALQIYLSLKDKNGIGAMYAELGNDYSNIGNDSTTIYYLEKCIAINKELGDFQQIAQAYTSLGVAANNKGESFQALQYYELAYEYCLKGNIKEGAGYNLNNIGGIYQNFGKHESATEYFLKSLKIREEIHDTIGMASCYKNLAVSYQAQMLKEQFLLSLEKSLSLYQQINDSSGISNVLLMLGNAYIKFPDKIRAKYYLQRSLDIAQKINNNNRLMQVYKSFGVIYKEEGNYREALIQLDKGLSISKNLNAKITSEIIIIMGQIYLLKNDFILSQKYGEEALMSAQEMGAQQLIGDASKLLSVTYSKQGKYKEALEMHIIYKNSSDSILSAETQKSVASKIFMYEIEKKETANKLLNTKIQLQAAILSKQTQQKQIAYISLLCVVGIGGYGFYRYRKSRQSEKQRALIDERMRISRELHDDMGSTLSSISVYSEVAKSQAAKQINDNQALEKIGNASRDLIDKMSDIVWSLNPSNDNFERLKNRMLAFAAIMLAPKNIAFKFDIDEQLKFKTLTPQQLKNIYLIYKEAINNVAKYADASEVNISIKVESNKVQMQINDNGKGFDPSEVKGKNNFGGNGLNNMHARAKEILASLNIISSLNNGTNIQLELRT